MCFFRTKQMLNDERGARAQPGTNLQELILFPLQLLVSSVCDWMPHCAVNSPCLNTVGTFIQSGRGRNFVFNDTCLNDDQMIPDCGSHTVLSVDLTLVW